MINEYVRCEKCPYWHPIKGCQDVCDIKYCECEWNKEQLMTEEKEREEEFKIEWESYIEKYPMFSHLYKYTLSWYLQACRKRQEEIEGLTKRINTLEEDLQHSIDKDLYGIEEKYDERD